ncbi:MAG: carboxylate/amino acid/amine transporter [Desulforhopalus sp.]|nr:carboxylate/amino acid/amine transporter [Desulforhopalus sp.]
MNYLIITTLIWAFSFSLIGVYLAGQVDSYFAVLVRIVLATLLFLPLLRKVRVGLALRLMALGAVQLGIMYVFYYKSFLLLTVPEVLLFTVLTPVYVTLIFDLIHHRFSARYLFTAALAVLGAVIIRYHQVGDNALLGFLVVQGANFSFALGQVGYKVLIKREQLREGVIGQAGIFGWFYLGATVVAVAAFILWGNLEKLPTTGLQWGILIYLGVVASGLGYFLWNKGATMVDSGVLAIMNNVLIPAGLVVNLVIWNRDADLVRLGAGGTVLLLSLFLHEHWRKVQKVRG